ncbi:aminotransferase class I/II-fold pyridoxal phosphate-dependent enzyme [bacterium BFN5]|nr:aminotransferase class I/II-fold pyridoxal phosphate-dependent enzyme [bacterium BFN5]QJW44965.1 aminotransferase class I/II-fold pyridoxal phosphate-dependent enzyme [bacterium BFN5]
MLEQALRMQGLTSAIFSQVDEMRRAELAKGKDVITLSIGSPDLAPAPHIIQALNSAAADLGSYGYTLSKGLSEFSEAVASWYESKFGVFLDPEKEIHSLIGSQEGLAHISLCLVNPNDVVLIPDPGYPIYSAGPLMAGAQLYHMPLTAEHEFLPDLEAIPEAILKRTKIMILNYPNNPLAAVAPRQFFSKVIEYAKRYSFIVCHDFAYSDLVFDGYQPDSFLSLPGAKDVAVEFNSLSKTYNMAGCRVGYIVGNSNVIELLGRLKSNFDYGIFNPIQKAAIAALTGPQQCVADTATTYQRRRDIIVEGLNSFGWHVEKPKASMYVWAPVPTRQSSVDFAADLLRHTGVAVIPGVAFGRFGEGFVRFALVQPESRLEEAVVRMRQWLG